MAGSDQKTTSSWFYVGYFVPVPGTEEMKARAPISIKLIAAHEPEESTERQSHLPRSKKPRVEEEEILRTCKVRVFPDAAQRVLICKWYGDTCTTSASHSVKPTGPMGRSSLTSRV